MVHVDTVLMIAEFLIADHLVSWWSSVILVVVR
jgi:hypothetical protein